MTKTRSTKRALLMSGLALLMCVSMLIGSTFAWFTDSVTSSGNKIQSGTLVLDLELLDKDGNWNSIKETEAAIFNYDLWEPGYTDVKILKIENEGNLALKWIAKFVSAEELGILADVIDVYVKPSATELTYPNDRVDLTEENGWVKKGTVKDFVDTIEQTTYGSLKGGESAYLGIALKMQESAGNDYQGKTLGAFDIQILATQDTVENDSFNNQYDKDATYPDLADPWDGSADTSWYNDTDTNFTIDTAEELAGFAQLVNGGNTFAGKTVMMGSSFDMAGTQWTPIGNWNSSVFSGVFDGQNKAILNLTINKTNKSGTERLALFGNIKNATIQNVVVSGADISADANIARGAVVVMCAGGTSNTISNVTVNDSAVTMKSVGQTYANGVVAWAQDGSSIFMNDITVSGLTLTASQTSGDPAEVASVLGYLNQADGKKSHLKNFNVSDVEINVNANRTFGGGVLGDISKGAVTVSNGKVDNVAMVINSTNAGVENDIGGLISYPYKVDHLTVTDVAITGLDIDFTGSSSKVGGVTGRDQAVSDYKNVSVSGSITENITTGSGSECGGFVGISYYYPKTYVDCSADVDMTTGGIAGGFVGTSCPNGWGSQYDSYTGCIAKGDVASDIAGGFVGKGWLTNNTTLLLKNVKSYGAVTGKNNAGGLIGGAWQGTGSGNIVIEGYTASENVVGAISGEIIGVKEVKNYTVK